MQRNVSSARRTCLPVHIHVLSGSDSETLAREDEQAQLERNSGEDRQRVQSDRVRAAGHSEKEKRELHGMDVHNATTIGCPCAIR